MFREEHLRLCRLINEQAQQLKQQVYLVGGVVRDLLLGKEINDKDLDLVVIGDAIELAEKVLGRKIQ